MSTEKTKVSRRKFMLALGAGGAGAVAVALTGQVGQSGEAGKTADKGAGKGYRLSEHVRNYYRTARV